jgi:hypothetical protein
LRSEVAEVIKLIQVFVGAGLGKIKRKLPIISQSKPALSHLYLAVYFK